MTWNSAPLVFLDETRWMVLSWKHWLILFHKMLATLLLSCLLKSCQARYVIWRVPITVRLYLTFFFVFSLSISLALWGHLVISPNPCNHAKYSSSKYTSMVEKIYLLSLLIILLEVWFVTRKYAFNAPKIRFCPAPSVRRAKKMVRY
jgi:hypothetical protein